MKIAVLGGGNMGGAIAWGAIAKGVVESGSVVVSHPRPLLVENAHAAGVELQVCNDNALAIKGADMVVVAVKPWLVESVLAEIREALDRKNQMVVSVVAGVSFEMLNSYLGSERLGAMAIYRVIPNTAISLGQSVTLICGSNAMADQNRAVDGLFGALGGVFHVSQSEIGAATALTSCGIAYAFKYIDAALSGAQQMGLDRVLSREMLLQTIKGAVAMLEANGEEPQTEIDKVTTPGGITLRGLDAMQSSGFSTAVINGLLASK